MDYAAAIEDHRQPLLRIVATLYTMIGLAEGSSIQRLARPLYRKVLALLGPAEAAVRRLIFAAAQDVVIATRATRPPRKKPATASKRKPLRRLDFRLFDLRKRLRRLRIVRSTKAPVAEPRIHFFHRDPRTPIFRQAPPPAPAPAPVVRDGAVNATRLCRRLAAILDALQDLPRQAKRYARLQARASAKQDPELEEKLELRFLPPPRSRRKPSHEVHEILARCDWLARAVPSPDTS